MRLLPRVTTKSTSTTDLWALSVFLFPLFSSLNTSDTNRWSFVRDINSPVSFAVLLFGCCSLFKASLGTLRGVCSLFIIITWRKHHAWDKTSGWCPKCRGDVYLPGQSTDIRCGLLIDVFGGVVFLVVVFFLVFQTLLTFSKLIWKVGFLINLIMGIISFAFTHYITFVIIWICEQIQCLNLLSR